MKIKKYTFHLLILVTLFIPMLRVDASSTNPNEPCVYSRNMSITDSGGTRRYPDNYPCVGQTTQAQTSQGIGCQLVDKPKFQDLLSYATCIISSSVIPLIFALAVALFVFGVVRFVINSSEEAKKEQGRSFMIWGIVALAVMVSVWGLVKILGNTFGIEYIIPQVSPTTPPAKP